MHNRLLFALCRSCCEEMRQDDCNHEDVREREFTGTWVDASTGKGGLFAEYVNAVLQIKQQASGWPERCKSESDKASYLAEYERDEGIKLQREKIEKNAGLRAVAKLCLNSFWGKFGQRNNLKQTEIVKTREALIKLLTAPDKRSIQ